MIYMFLADGFEEIEALGTLDILRRADIDIITVGVGEEYIRGAHNILVKADTTIQRVSKEDCMGVILPGGLPGTTNLEASLEVQSFLDYAVERDILICAICAAPSILGHKGILKGKRATSYPGYESELLGAQYTGNSSEIDGMIITGKGAGAVFDFGLSIVEKLKGREISNRLRSAMQCTE